MAIKQVKLPEVGPITLYKRKGSRTIRLSVTSTGQIRVSMPTWVPYSAGITFAKQKREWLLGQKRPPILLKHGMRIGQKHRLLFGSDPSRQRVATRLMKDGAIIIKMPYGHQAEDELVQAAALKACIRALKSESEAVLPGRLRALAAEHGFDFRSVSVKQLKSRWGSCNHRQEIVLNCYLMQLPWHLIDYVLLHELMHTQIMEHGPRFWASLEKYVPNLARVRKEMRAHQPTIKEILAEEH